MGLSSWMRSSPSLLMYEKVRRECRSKGLINKLVEDLITHASLQDRHILSALKQSGRFQLHDALGSHEPSSPRTFPTLRVDDEVCLKPHGGAHGLAHVHLDPSSSISHAPLNLRKCPTFCMVHQVHRPHQQHSCVSDSSVLVASNINTLYRDCLGRTQRRTISLSCTLKGTLHSAFLDGRVQFIAPACWPMQGRTDLRCRPASNTSLTPASSLRRTSKHHVVEFAITSTSKSTTISL